LFNGEMLLNGQYTVACDVMTVVVYMICTL